MKKNTPVTQNEHKYSSTTRLVSTTDTKGRITHANQEFVEVSGFNFDELKDKAHNIVRHPDVPPPVFEDMWNNLKQGKPWMGVVKNRCKNGDHYWVDAFVTPIFSNGQVDGFQSVRMMPEERLKESAERVYAKVWNPPSKLRGLFQNINLGIRDKIIAAGTINLLIVLLAVILQSYFPPVWVWSVCITAFAVFNVFSARLICEPLEQLVNETKETHDNAIARDLYAGRQDEIGQLKTVLHFNKLNLETVVWRIGDATHELETSVDTALNVTLATEQAMHQQKREVEQVATAMNEMTMTVQEVAKSTTQAASSSQEANQEVSKGKDIVSDTIEQIINLAEMMKQANNAIHELSQHSSEIGTIVEVINTIAEQTNLLALNAAIEAARAGEQGRGFAVVADEVRTLAGKTQSSTLEIQEMIRKLQESSSSVVQVIESGHETVDDCVSKGNEAGSSLESIMRAVDTITQMTNQIATAAEEQSAVSEEINRNITHINDQSNQTLESSQTSLTTNQQLSAEVNRLNQMVKQFGIQDNN